MKRKGNIKKKILNLMLTIILASGILGEAYAQEDEMIRSASGQSIRVTLRYEGIGETYIYPETLTLTDPERTYAEDGITGTAVADADYYTPLDAMINYSRAHGGDPAQDIKIGSGGMVGDFLGKIDAGGGETLMFAVGNQAGDRGMDQYELHDGDQLVLYKYPNQYAWLDQESYEVRAWEAADVKLSQYAYDKNWNQVVVYPQNAELLLMDADGLALDKSSYTAGRTDAEGKASIMVYKEGDYILAAQDAAGPDTFCRPYAKLTVRGSAELADAEKAKAAADSLTLGNTSSVTGDLILPVSWDYQTTVTWTSSDQSLVENDGAVHRPIGEDRSAVLTAVVKSGEETAQKSIIITVKGCSLALKSLSVAPGALNYSPDKMEYAIYVKDAVSAIEVTAATKENVQGMALSIGTERFDTLTAEGHSVNVSLSGDVTDIPVAVTMRQESSSITIRVKRTKNPGDPLADLPASWGQFLGDASNNAVAASASPVEKGSLKWESYSNNPGSWGSYAGTPILVNGTLYAARNDRLEIIDITDGHTVKSVKLASGLGFYSYITYGDGKIFVPLGNGSIQCFNAATLESLFLTEIPTTDGLFSLQSATSIHYSDKMIYTGYTNGASSDEALKGFFAAYDTTDIDKDLEDEVAEPAWTYGDASYYGAGAVSVGNFLVFGGDDGKIISVYAKTGKQAGAYQLTGRMRCLPVYAQGYIWVTTQKGKIYKLGLAEDGTLSLAASADLPANSSSSPVVSGGKVYVTGGTFTGGFVSVYNSSLKQLASVDSDGQCNTPALTTAYDDAYLYFTQNKKPGGIYAAKITAGNEIKVQTLYAPVHENYSLSKVIIGEDGTLYFTNDAGYIYAIGHGKADENGVRPGGEEEAPQEGGKDPARSPAPAPTGTAAGNLPDASGFKPVKRTIKTTVKKAEEKSGSEWIKEALEKKAADGDNSLTVKNVPDTIEAAVFSALAVHPDFRLVLDCGTYTISMKGSDVKHPDASLRTKLEERESTMSEEKKELFGKSQELVMEQEGPFPGRITIVYRLPEQLKDSRELHLYSFTRLNDPEDVTVQRQHAMFVLEVPGTYILSAAARQEEDRTALETAADIDGTVTGPRMTTSDAGKAFPIWGWFLICGVGGAVLGFAVTALVITKRKKAQIWGKE